jgi:hypothetical protein
MTPSTSSPARPATCPHCRRDARPHHYRDAGNITPAAADALGYCPVLAAARRGASR